MSKMRSASKIAVVTLCTLGALSACQGVDVNSPNIRGIAYVKVDDVMKHAPLYPQLSRLDDAIAMVDLTEAAPNVPRSAAQIASEDKKLLAELNAAKKRTQQIIYQKQRDYAAREQAAVAAALGAAHGRSPGDAAAAFGRVSQQQAEAAEAQAGRDFQAYQQSVVQQSNGAARSVVSRLQQEAVEKLQAKQLQEQQRETDLQLQLSRQDATRRLALQTRLSMLALDDATRRQLEAQLNAITTRESTAMTAQREADRREFLAYREQVTTQMNAAMHGQLSQIQSQTQTELASRRNQVGAQLRAMVAPPIGRVAPATQAQIRKIAAAFQSQYQADVQNVITEYAETSDTLAAQYAMLHASDMTAAGAVQQEVLILEQRRQTLYNQILAQIQRDAQRLAEEKGLRLVFSDVTAAPGGYDMTNELIRDIESERE